MIIGFPFSTSHAKVSHLETTTNWPDLWYDIHCYKRFTREKHATSIQDDPTAPSKIQHHSYRIGWGVVQMRKT